MDAIGALELLFAKADFALDFGCTIPRFSPDSARRLVLNEARHPLLEDVLRRQRKPVVPITLELDEDAAHAADQRSEHRRQDRLDENGRTAGC